MVLDAGLARSIGLSPNIKRMSSVVLPVDVLKIGKISPIWDILPAREFYKPLIISVLYVWHHCYRNL